MKVKVELRNMMHQAGLVGLSFKATPVDRLAGGNVVFFEGQLHVGLVVVGLRLRPLLVALVDQVII